MGKVKPTRVIRWNGKDVIFSYSNKDITERGSYFASVEGFSCMNSDNGKVVNTEKLIELGEEAYAYLLRNAVEKERKANGRTLIGIIRIKENIECGAGIGFKVIGVGVYN